MSLSNPRRICLVGVRGVGKTTLIRKVIDRLPTVDYIVGSAVLRELAGAEFERFDHLDPSVKTRFREQAIDWMEARQAQTGKHILCDGHTSLLDESTGTVGPVFTERDCRFFRELILLEAPVASVLEHRRADPSKRRSLDPTIVAAEVDGERRTSQRIAESWGMRYHMMPISTDPSATVRLTEILSE